MKTKVISILTIILIVCSFSSTAKKVNHEKAKNVAINFYYERINQYHKIEISEILIKNSFSEYIGSTKVLYVFNFDPKGFVIVSANDAVKPILAFSFNNYINKAEQPENFKAWIKQYKQQINYMFENNLKAKKETIYEWARLTSKNLTDLKIFNSKEVSPLLTTVWNQGAYYNEMCPADPAGPGGHCYAGCVPTAMGQVVNYFRFPLQGSGSYSYYCPPYDTLSANFGNTDYLWNEMPQSLTFSNIPIAELLYHLGVSCDLVYGPNGSGMYNHKAAYSLRTYFNYSPETKYIFRDSTTMDWDSLLIAHLDQKIPMYYAGWSVPNVNGHAFVCDGYQGSDYFHFNWGWGGSSNGYFYTNALNPGGSNFNLAQEVIINCFPDTVNYQYPYFCNGTDTLTSIAGTIDDGSGPVYNYQNSANCNWLIAPDDSVEFIRIGFIKFKTETNDIFTVYDGDNTSAPVLGVFSGDSVNELIISSGDKVLINFTSDGNTNDKGWHIYYESEIPEYCHGLTTLNNIVDTISDGSGPRNYHNSTVCMWKISPDNPDEIVLFFDEFETEDGNDLFKVFDGSELIGEYSGNELPEPVTAFSGSMFITFTTNTSVTAPGWKVHYVSNYVNINEQKNIFDVKIFPNPANKKLNIVLNQQYLRQLSLEIISLSSELKTTIPIKAFSGILKKEIEISDYPTGMYILKISGEDFIKYKKLLITK